MILVCGDAWAVGSSFNALCILTNGIVKSNGELVMGAGIALQAKERYPQLPGVIGSFVKQYGNRVFNLGEDKKTGIRLVSFPTKHDYKDDSDLNLIATSCQQLMELATKSGWNHILLPRPGVGKGNLKWEDVQVILEQHLDDRFFVISNNPLDIDVLPQASNYKAPEVRVAPKVTPVVVATPQKIKEEIKEVKQDTEVSFPEIEDNTDEIIPVEIQPKSVDVIPMDKKPHIPTVCVTGHRPKDLWGYHSSAKYQQLQNKIYYCLKQFHDQYSVSKFISGGAQGVDQLFFWVAEHICKKEYTHCINEVYIPFNGQECAWVDEGKFGKTEYSQMLNVASKVHVVNKVVTSQSPKEHIVKALYDRNAEMVKDSDYVLGVYKGNVSDITSTTPMNGGTLHALRLAYKAGKHIVVINPFTLATTKINF